MQSFGKFKPRGSEMLGGMAMGMLFLGVACGAAATATPAPKPAAKAPAATVAPAAPAATPTATPVPAPTSPPATAVNPGKLTWMISGWGNERFTYNFAVGGGNNFGRILHGQLIATNEKAGLLPGPRGQ